MRRAAFLLAALLLAVAPARSSSVPFFEIGVRHGSVAMDDVNDRIRDLDVAIEADFEEILRGTSPGASFGLATGPSTAVLFRWERLFARSEAEGPGGPIAYDMGAHLITGCGELRRAAGRRASFGAGFGGGVILASGETKTAGLDISGGTSGAGTVLLGYLFAELPLRERLFLLPSAGYRRARVENLEAGGRALFTSGGNPMTADYTGAWIALSLRYYLGE